MISKPKNVLLRYLKHLHKKFNSAPLCPPPPPGKPQTFLPNSSPEIFLWMPISIQAHEWWRSYYKISNHDVTVREIVVYNGVFTKTATATTHQRNIILNAIWIKRMWVTARAFWSLLKARGEKVYSWVSCVCFYLLYLQCSPQFSRTDSWHYPLRMIKPFIWLV